MTWEEKLFELLETRVKEFNCDLDVSQILKRDNSLETIACGIEIAIRNGDLIFIKAELPKFVTILQKWKILLRHLNKNPACVDKTMCGNNFKWHNGIFALGYNFAPNGIKGIERKMLYFSRLVRDAEKRALKHPRYR